MHGKSVAIDPCVLGAELANLPHEVPRMTRWDIADFTYTKTSMDQRPDEAELAKHSALMLVLEFLGEGGYHMMLLLVAVVVVVVVVVVAVVAMVVVAVVVVA